MNISESTLSETAISEAMAIEMEHQHLVMEYEAKRLMRQEMNTNGNGGLLMSARKPSRQKQYAEERNHPQWQKKRLQILERDGWACQDCGCDQKTLNVHHIEYIDGRKVWEYDDAHLVTLCMDCHAKRHMALRNGGIIR